MSPPSSTSRRHSRHFPCFMQEVGTWIPIFSAQSKRVSPAEAGASRWSTKSRLMMSDLSNGGPRFFAGGHELLEELYGARRVGGVAVGPDVVTELRGHRRPPDGDLDVEAFAPHRLDHGLHVDHRRGEKGAHPQDSGLG